MAGFGQERRSLALRKREKRLRSSVRDEFHALYNPSLHVRIIGNNLVIYDLAVSSSHPDLERGETAMAQLIRS